MGPVVACDRCGITAPPGTSPEQPPLGWSGGRERGRWTWLCPRCTRDNARNIEGKLDPDWW